MLKHLTQPTHDSCVVTCLAMITGKSVESLWEYHEKLLDMKVKTSDILDKLGVKYNERYSSHTSLFEGGTYLLTVPSLSFPGLFHQIVAQVGGGVIRVYDPARGLDGKKYYVGGDPENDLEVPLVSWVVDYEVFVGET